MKPELTPEVRSIVRAQLSRRRFIAGAGAVSGATLLAACGSKDGESESGSADATASAPVDEGGTVRWANWPAYLDFDSDKKTYTSLETFKAASGINVLREMRATMGIILQAQGVDPSQPFTDDQFMNAIAFLEKKIADGFIRQVKGNDYLEDMVSGDAVAVIGWSGDIFSLSNENGGKFGFQVPESGGTLWSDNAMIPSTSKNKKYAETVINNYYDPAVAAQVAAFVNYICPVVGAQAEMEKIDPELAKSPFIFPDDATLAKVRVFRTLTPEEETKYSEAFQAAAGN